MHQRQSPPQPRQASPPAQSTDDGLVRAMSSRYAAERGGTPRTGAFSPGGTAQATPSGRTRQHDPYRSSDALRALPDEPSVAASAMLPSAAAAAPAGLRARRDPPAPPAAPVTGTAFSKGGYQAPKLGAPTAVAPNAAAAAGAISDSDDEDGAVRGTDSLTVGGARLSPGAVYNPDVANGAVRSNRSPYLGAGPAANGPQHPQQQQPQPVTAAHTSSVRRTPGARAASDAAAAHHHKTGITTPAFLSSGPHSSTNSLPPRYGADPPKSYQHQLPMPPQDGAPAPPPSRTSASNAAGASSPAAGRTSGNAGDASIAAGPFTARDMERILQAAIASHNAAESPDAAPCADVACPAGLSLTVYNGDISQHFSVPSEDIQITRGAIKYVDHHTRYGAQTRFRFQLCHNFLLRKCPKLSECSYIHATQLPAPTQVHLNPFAPRRLAADRHGHSDEVAPSVQDDPSVVEQYEVLPAGTQLVVHPPNAAAAASKGRGQPAPPQRIPSDSILWTIGAKTAYDFAVSGGAMAAATRRAGDGPVPGSRPRHCAHYQFKRLCNLGRDCHFIHSKIPFAESAPQQAQPQATFSNNPNRGVRRTGAKPIPAEAYAPGAAPAPESTGGHYPNGSTPVSSAQGTGHPQHHQYPHGGTAMGSPAGAGGAMPPSPEGMSFLAGMQYAMQVLQMQQSAAGLMPGPAPLPVPSPPSIGVSPYGAGGVNAHTAASVFGSGGAAAATGPLAHIPAQQSS